jgi:3-oxoacyl-[acyl-carrier protein] reductase
MEINLGGKRALVSGSSSGIGAATARLLAKCGARVVVHGRNKERANAVAADIVREGGNALVVLADLCSAEQVQALVDDIHREFGGIDILVNNAGDAQPYAPDWFDADVTAWLAAYDRNVGSAVRLIHAFVPSMRTRGWGRVINVGSSSYANATPDFPAYGPTKAALVNLTINLARVLARTGVTANVVTPGAILTETMQSNMVPLARQMGWADTDLVQLEQRLATEKWPNNIGRMGRPADIAATIAFLASEFSSHMSASNFRVDGGETSSFH